MTIDTYNMCVCVCLFEFFLLKENRFRIQIEYSSQIATIASILEFLTSIGESIRIFYYDDTDVQFMYNTSEQLVSQSVPIEKGE